MISNFPIVFKNSVEALDGRKFSMAAQKRALEESSTSHKSKKSKVADPGPSKPYVTNLVAEEVDFPRGGGTSFTPVEVKAIRAEAVKEANEELFESQAKTAKKRKRKSEVQKASGDAATDKNDRIRIEHLNYKRLNIGMKILGQIVSIQPLALIVSLPNQLFAHVPITNISSQLTSVLEGMDESEEEQDDEEDEEAPSQKSRIPDLSEIFHEGQYVRAVVTAVHAQGATDVSGISKSRDEVARSSRRVELSLLPERVNAEVQKGDLKPGFASALSFLTITAAVKSIEDHGYILELGVPDVAGFLSFKDAQKAPIAENKKLYVGQVVDVTVTKMSSNGRTCNVSADPATFSSTSLSEVTNVLSVLPGTLVQALITAVHPTGLNLQVLGFFEGTVDQIHLRQNVSEKPYKVGKKVKARVLYNFSTSPPRFALALVEHVIALGPRKIQVEKHSSSPQTIQAAYPIGKVLESVKVKRLESERGLIAEIEPGLEGFVHISHVSDEHIPSLSSSGPWKVGSIHRARVTGYFPFDGLLQLSFKPSVINQKFFQVADVEVGEIIKGTIKKLTDTGLFVSLSGNMDGVVWPNHYADITLKQPSKRFKPGASIKCRVLVVDSDRKRISLTAKKTLVESTLPILSKFEDVKPGIVTHAVIFKVYEKHLMVEFFNNLKAMVPIKEVSESHVNKLSEAFPVGRVVKVRVISVEPEAARIIASIRQAASTFKSPVTDISAVEIGNIVEATVSEIHKDNVVLTLQPTQVRALISLKNLANHRSLSVPQLRVILKIGEKLDDLVVVTRNTEKSFVIVASKPKNREALPSKGTLSLESITIGQIVGGRVTRHTRHGALIKIAAHIGGILHPTDTSDDFEAGVSSPPIDSIIKATVVGIDMGRKQLTLSTRHSRMYPDQVKAVVDREISDLKDLHAGETVRGFIKSVAEHGLFVTIGRDIDARVQIRELFDEYVKEWKERFTANQIVKGRILSVDPETKKVEMSFRNPALKTSSSTLSVADLQIGQKVEGLVKRIEDYGLFIQIEGSKLSGLCHKSQLSDNKDADVTVALHGFREGDRVKAMIIGIEKRKISLSLRPSHFGDEDFEADEDHESKADESDEEPLGVIDEDVDMPVAGDASEHEGDEADNASEDDEDDDAMEVDVDQSAHLFQSSNPPKNGPVPTLPTPSLKLSGGFQWSSGQPQADEEAGSDSSSEESDTEGQPSKKKKRKRKEIEQDLTADMHTRTPESNADFERLLLGSPNSSYLWIQYMSFQLQLSEVDKARELARRAIRTINFREEQERLNVWIALLNLENVYGTDETLEAAFKEAARANDSKTVHLRLASILDQADKHEKAEEQYKRTCKKFGQSSKVWTLFCEYYLRRGELEEARKLLPRSLQSLDKRKHLKTISRFALLEYKLGEPERGKTIFEGIVDSHPKRWDLWSIYMDMEAGQSDIQSLRNLFDRVLALKMTSHKAKTFFKKWLELERKLGDEEGAETVKQKAVEWTQRANAS
ncbi:rRNA biogenesis protein RRP5 [Hypsizygus marmoreus]|uniref:rRNA biogenesis protein RRP5 n=1 Tax=Hypsizygus marmoreus TaxID=39966 RepID=A0A369KA29_HYPMA|nr:rRNA biogenesis protein RRP5 [Hypsizygus marmoreus]